MNAENTDNAELNSGGDESMWELALSVKEGGVGAAVRWSPTGLDLPENTSYEELRALLRSFKAYESAGAVALADVFSFARRKGWLEQMELDLEGLEYNPAMVHRALAIADVPAGLRHPWLKAEHYCVVSNMMYEDMMRWLKVAVERRMSALLLKRSVEQGRALTQEELDVMTGAGSGIPNYMGILTNWERWKRRVGGDDAILSWPRHQLERWVEEVEPIADLVERAKEVLGE